MRDFVLALTVGSSVFCKPAGLHNILANTGY